MLQLDKTLPLSYVAVPCGSADSLLLMPGPPTQSADLVQQTLVTDGA